MGCPQKKVYLLYGVSATESDLIYGVSIIEMYLLYGCLL